MRDEAYIGVLIDDLVRKEQTNRTECLRVELSIDFCSERIMLFLDSINMQKSSLFSKIDLSMRSKRDGKILVMESVG